MHVNMVIACWYDSCGGFVSLFFMVQFSSSFYACALIAIIL
jgi:hypothetical protein